MDRIRGTDGWDNLAYLVILSEGKYARPRVRGLSEDVDPKFHRILPVSAVGLS